MKVAIIAILILLLIKKGFYGPYFLFLGGYAVILAAYELLKVKFKIPCFFEISLLSIMFFHVLGTFYFYANVSWWDSLMHLVVASVLAMNFFVIFESLNQQQKIRVNLKFVTLFVAFFIMSEMKTASFMMQ